MERSGNRILISLLLFFLAIPAKAYEIKGFIQLEESWKRQIYLSSIRSFDDMNTASEEFVIASAIVEPDGSFLIQGAQLPDLFGLYRLHVVKKGDPVGTLFISGQEENNYHFVMNNASQLNFFSTGSLFTMAAFRNSLVNQNFDQLKEKIKVLQSAPAIPSKANWDYQEKQLQEYLLQYADTSQNVLPALFAIYHLNFEEDFNEYKDFLQTFLSKWKPASNASPYFLHLEQQVEFLRYQEGFQFYPFSIYIILIALVISIFVVWKKRKTITPPDPFLKKKDQLTIQEQKIFNLLVIGKTNKQISNELNIEVSTVKSHLNSIYSKLGVRSRKEIYNRGIS